LPIVFHTQQFEGPLDLLLQLIERAKVDIRDIFVSDITRQYVEIVQGMEFTDLEEGTAFLSMAATLLYIKSRVLLPKPPKTDEEDEEDTEEAFIRRIETYKAIRDACVPLKEREAEVRGTYWKRREEMPIPPPPLDESNLTMDNLLMITLGMLARNRTAAEAVQLQPRVIRRDSYHVHVQRDVIRRALALSPRLRFGDLFQKQSRMEVAVTFMALLEMWKINEICIEQSGVFGDIWVTKAAAETEGNDHDFT